MSPNRYLCRAAVPLVACLLQANGLAAADAAPMTRCSAAFSDNFQTQLYGTISTRGWVGDVTGKIHDVISDVTDEIAGEGASAVTGLVQQLVDEVAYVLSRPVTIKGEIQGLTKTGFEGMLTHRPEWFVDPPPWLIACSRAYFGGISLILINEGVTIGVDAVHGDIAWNDPVKNRIFTALVKEARTGVEDLTKYAVASVDPTLAVLINSQITYGFDQAEDAADEKISQHFAPTGSGAAAAKTKLDAKLPVGVVVKEGTVLTSVLIANEIVIGESADLTLVTPVDPAAPSYFAAIGGRIVIRPDTILTGNIVLTQASSVTNLPDALKTRSKELIGTASLGGDWIDSELPITPPPAGGG